MQEEINRCRAWFEAHTDMALDLVRTYLGVALVFKAIYFMSHREELLGLMSTENPLWVGPAVIIHYIILAHFTGGIFLALGLLTRIAAFLQIPVLMGAVFYIHLPRMLALGPRENVELTALVLFLSVVVFFFGAGRLSLDYYFFRREVKSMEPGQAAPTGALHHPGKA
jgi:uncharacterized membrane protein YphA (DoxX/SURF4 family)